MTERTIITACPLDCYDACSFSVTEENGQITQLEGNKDHPITKGVICGRGRRLKERTYASYRILHPLKRVQDKWVRLSWEQAISEVSRNIRQAMDLYGHQSIFHCYDWGSGALLKSLNQRFFYALGGCTETVGSLCWNAGLQAQQYDMGEARSHAPDDLLNSSAIVVWGRNAAVTNMHILPFLREAQSLGAKLWIINPLPTDLDARADKVISLRPGTDGVLALAVLKRCIQFGYLDREFINQYSIGWEEFESQLSAFDYEDLVRQTGVSAEDIHQLAELYGTKQPVATLLGIGLQRYQNGGQNIRAIDALVAATGHIGVPGGGVQYASRDMGQYFDTKVLTGDVPENIRTFSRGKIAECMEMAEPPIQVMVVTRTNPLTQIPNTKKLESVLKKVPCKVVIDTFMTRTAEMADYILPCTTVFEEEDFTYTTMWHAYGNFIQPVVSAQGEAKADWEIFKELANALGLHELYDGSPKEWIAKALRPLIQTGVSLDEAKQRGFIKVPLSDIAFEDKKFLTSSGRFEFASDKAEKDGLPRTAVDGWKALTPLDEGQYHLITAHPRKSENSQHAEFPKLPSMPIVQIHFREAEKMGIVAGDIVQISTQNGVLLAEVRLLQTGYPKAVLLEEGWWNGEHTINHLTGNEMADMGDQTAQYECLCTISPIQQEGNEDK
ncbi:molybdopterin-dependent oxidoreductase [Alicyclobacillus sp. TC]|uniref:molybdopterin-dependent oxidoreductase n=1 Tax=Alicyclobacillus sp. TC TaxID=2606450 RepID=UPI001932601D|nr:molybdopterin-dependent oxidoreductase [Alicyclobacillus sp. TC]QRF24529.1 molybdopterin-dependent oxidoreductase [Alicyclobacillus sp. TC]